MKMIIIITMIIKKSTTTRLLLATALILFSCESKKDVENYSRAKQIDISLKTIYDSSDSLFLQARTTMIPRNNRSNYITTCSIYGHGVHAYGGLYFMETDNSGDDWSCPIEIEELKEEILSEGLTRVIGDVTPAWHEMSEMILCTGKTFYLYSQKTSGDTITEQRIDIEDMQEVSYAIYNPNSNIWSSLKTLDLPEKLDNGDDFHCANAGCTQRVDMADGSVLLPIRYKKNGRYVSIVIKCSFDGQVLKYIGHGTSLTISKGRGLYEPSLCKYRDKYYLTMRADDGAYVSKSDDGLNFESIKEWKFSDTSLLGSYNTQQHWISNKHGLFLVYTRKGANNNHIFRHRAPLFIGEVHPNDLFVFKETEKVIMPIPTDQGALGNFGVTYVNEDESWVTASVTPGNLNSDERETKMQISVIRWPKQ